ncbi:hypothetical protein BC830DRAFT_521832 [Chytriomyces sp. MP71]|nr:hypothetical protein BC830DRAFT_521832 [Chytriomyces sp. MP71]
MLGEDRSARTGSTDPRARAKSPLGRLVNWITGNKEGEDPHAEPEPDVAVPARASSSAQGQIEAHAKIESVIAAFTATREDEIELSIGDKVAIAQIHDDGFAHGTNQRTGKFGAFPYSAVSHSAASEPHSIGERVSSLLGAVTGTVTNAASAVGSTVTSFFHHSEAGPAHQAGSGLAATQVAIGEYVKAGPNDLRSPCPALNSLANHGHLPRNGRLITADMLVNAVKEVYNIDPSQLISSVFPLRAAASSGVRTADQVNELGVEYINLNDLGLHSHSSIEHDVSLTRNDAYFGDNSAVVPEFVEAMIAESTDGDYVSREDMTRHRLKRFNDSKARNPELSYNVKQATTASFEAAVALNVLGRDDKIPLEHVRSFFLEERIPDNYQKPVVEASIFLTEVKTAQLLTEWGYALTFNKTQKPEEALPVDTRTFSLRQIQTNEIEKHMIPANASNVPKQVPAKWHGIFYTDGNPSADQCCSIANGTWHEDKNAYYIPVYGPGIWGWDDSLAGRALFEATRATSLNYKIQFDSHTGIASFHPVYAFGSAHHFLQVEIPGTFIAIPTDNPNIFIRRTNIFGGDGYAEYRLVRIVDGEGRRTPEYESIYLSRLNRDQEETVEGTVKSGKTHLRSTQMIAVVDQGDVNVAAYSVQIVTGEEFRGLSGAQIEVTVHHSESDVTDAEIKSTGPITLSTSPS